MADYAAATPGVKYSIVVPVYNSGRWLNELVDGVYRAMEELEDEFELILVNDASTDDDTWAEIEKLAEDRARVRGIDLLYNVGQFRATLCGIEQAAGRYIITMDDDLQHPPEELRTLVEAMHAYPGKDCIMGAYVRKQHGPLQNAGSRVMSWLMGRMYERPKGVVTSSFRIMPSEFARMVAMYRVAYPQMGPLISKLSKEIMNVPVSHNSRPYGKSGYSLARSIQETFQSIVNSSVMPLRLFSLVGFISAGLAFLSGIWFLFRWAVGGVGVPGFTSLILAISFFSGMLLLGIGMLGEYVGRIINELTGMPRYHIRRKTGGCDE